MDQLGRMLWDMRGYSLAGGIVLAIGIAVLLAGRSAGPQSARTTRWISFPLLGCGGCLLLYPLIALGGVLAVGFGVAAFCEQAVAC